MLLLLILCFAIVCSIDIRLALSMLIAPALSIVPLSLLFKNFERDYAAYWTASERVNSTLVEYIDGIEVIKTFNQADSSYARFRNDISEFEKLTLAWYRSARVPHERHVCNTANASSGCCTSWMHSCSFGQYRRSSDGSCMYVVNRRHWSSH